MSQGVPESEEIYQKQLEADRTARNRIILERLERGEFTGQVTVILVIGPTGAGKTNFIKLLTGQDLPVWEKLSSGTIKSWAVLQELGDRQFLFIDTPGFGHPDLVTKNVKESIYEMLGYFTRCFGGIHGIIYINDIQPIREMPGLRDSFEFLKELIKDVCPLMTFITTRWDCIVPKEMNGCIKREGDLRKMWKKGLGIVDLEIVIIRCEASCKDDEPAYLEGERTRLTNLVLARYHLPPTQVRALVMPFSELSFGQRIGYVAEVGGDILLTLRDATDALLQATGGIRIGFHYSIR